MQERTFSVRTRSWRRAAAPAALAVAMLVAGGSASAFNYASGDLVAIFVDGDSELTVNLGPVASLSGGSTFDFVTPPGFGPDGSTGGKVVFFATTPPFSGSLGRNVTFSNDLTFDPSKFDHNVSAYVARIGLAQSALDDGGTIDKFLEFLNNFPSPPTGGVITNGPDELALLASNPASYSSTIGSAGDRIDNQLPFDTDLAIGTSGVAGLWRVQRTSTTTAQTTLLGLFRVDGNVGGGTPTTRITYLPEPGQASLLASGLGLLAALAARRRPVAR